MNRAESARLHFQHCTGCAEYDNHDGQWKRESGPGWAKFTADDTPESVERKMADAFGPLHSMLEHGVEKRK